MSNSLWPHGEAHQSLPSMEFPGKSTGVGWHFLLQGIFQTQGSNLHVLCLLHWQAGSLSLLPPGRPVCVHTHVRVHVCVCVCVWHLLPVNGHGLFPCLGYCKQCCYEYWSVCILKLEFSFFLDIRPGVRSLNLLVTLCWAFLGPSLLFFTVAVLNYFPTNSVEGFPFLHNLSSIYYL